MTGLPDYKYLTKLNVIALIDVMLGDTKIDRLDAIFSINLEERQFEFSVENISTQLWNPIDYYYWRKDDVHADRTGFLYGIDENKVPFTVFDCSICPMQIPLKTIRIVWNDIIIGQHISDKNACLINQMQCVVEDSKKNYRCSVGKHEYTIESGTIAIKTNWSELPDEKNNKVIFNGTLFKLTSNTLIPLEKMKESFYRLLEMYSLWIGYFPEIKDMRFNNDSEKFIYARHHPVYFSANHNVRLDRMLHPHDKHNNNFSTQYDKWVEIREKNIPILTMFKNALNGRDIIYEARTSILIQCLEGYFNTHHKENLIKPYLDGKAKEAIINTVFDSLNESDEIKNLFGINHGKIINSVKSLLGRIHRMSLKETILFAIDYTPYTQKIFDHERNEKISEAQTQLDIFVQKAVKHRDFMSHLFRPIDYFSGNENDLAKKKLDLLLRLCFLHDIGLEVTEKSLDNCIWAIDREFYGNKKNETINN